MIDPNKPTTATQEQTEELKQSLLQQELQELLDDDEEYHWG